MGRISAASQTSYLPYLSWFTYPLMYFDITTPEPGEVRINQDQHHGAVRGDGKIGTGPAGSVQIWELDVDQSIRHRKW
eukprot:s31_g25.t1